MGEYKFSENILSTKHFSLKGKMSIFRKYTLDKYFPLKGRTYISENKHYAQHFIFRRKTQYFQKVYFIQKNPLKGITYIFRMYTVYKIICL